MGLLLELRIRELFMFAFLALMVSLSGRVGARDGSGFDSREELWRMKFPNDDNNLLSLEHTV
jgi:hypothetical protein